MRDSSANLHPETGARFVFERVAEAPPRYAVTVYLPGARTVALGLWWDEGDAVQLDPQPADAWVHAEVLKLARVLHREPKSRLTRWRG